MLIISELCLPRHKTPLRRKKLILRRVLFWSNNNVYKNGCWWAGFFEKVKRTTPPYN